MQPAAECRQQRSEVQRPGRRGREAADVLDTIHTVEFNCSAPHFAFDARMVHMPLLENAMIKRVVLFDVRNAHKDHSAVRQGIVA